MDCIASDVDHLADCKNLDASVITHVMQEEASRIREALLEAMRHKPSHASHPRPVAACGVENHRDILESLRPSTCSPYRSTARRITKIYSAPFG